MKNTFGDIVLFEIPIYSMTEEVFRKKWEQKIMQYLPQRDATDFKKINGFIHELYRKKMLWQYNQIVGYITVNASKNNDITFSIYRPPLGRKIRYDSPNKYLMEDWMCLGYHFYAEDYSDEDLIAEIKSWVSDMINEYAKKPLYADTSLFDATIDCINIKKLIEIRKSQDKGNNE